MPKEKTLKKQLQEALSRAGTSANRIGQLRTGLAIKIDEANSLQRSNAELKKRAENLKLELAYTMNALFDARSALALARDEIRTNNVAALVRLKRVYDDGMKVTDGLERVSHILARTLVVGNSTKFPVIAQRIQEAGGKDKLGLAVALSFLAEALVEEESKKPETSTPNPATVPPPDSPAVPKAPPTAPELAGIFVIG